MCELIILVAAWLPPAPNEAPAWPQFRGPAGAGVASDDAQPPTQIGPDTNLKWKVAVPPGASLPVVARDRIFITAFEDGKLFTIAYRQADGAELWRKQAPVAKIEPVDKRGLLSAFEVKTGKEVYQRTGRADRHLREPSRGARTRPSVWAGLYIRTNKGLYAFTGSER